MALVTVTGNVTDITGKPDPDQLSFYTPEIRDGVLSTRVQRINPNPTTGAFSVQLQEGPAKVRVRGRPYDFTAAAGDLWAMIQVGLSIPPETPAQKLADVVNAWTQSVADAKYASATALTGKADLVSGKLNPAQLPDLGVVDYLGDVASQSAMLALSGQKGDWCTRSDDGTAWIIIGSNPTQIASWKKLPLPAAALTKAAADAAYAPLWQANTAYAAGALTVSPTGVVGTAKTSFTSGATYNPANWTAAAGGNGMAITDNGDGTASVTSTGSGTVTDNNDGTATIAA